MPVQAIPLALIASLYPLGLAALVLLARASAKSRSRVAVFLTGAVACTLAVGFAVVFVLRGAGLGQAGHHAQRYGLRLAIGLALLVAAAVLTRWRPRPRGGQSRVVRAAERGGLAAAFLAGVALYLPSPVYLTALQDVGAARLTVTLQVAWVVALAVLALITIEAPALLFLLAPGWTVPRLEALDAWLRRNRRALIVSVLAALGLWQTLDGLFGLL